jgi:hypothetical protein
MQSPAVVSWWCGGSVVGRLAISQVTQFELTEMTDVELTLAIFEAEFCSCDSYIRCRFETVLVLDTSIM